jgi:hypothetical protein
MGDMARPSKTISLMTAEGRSHLTKAEKERRTAAESGLATGVPMRAGPEVKADADAAGMFRRIAGLLKKMGKNDAVYEAVINRYCLIFSECRGLEKRRAGIAADLADAEGGKFSGDLNPVEVLELKGRLTRLATSVDKLIDEKRKMMFAIEKENIMTIAGSLRGVPKKVKSPADEVRKLLRGG